MCMHVFFGTAVTALVRPKVHPRVMHWHSTTRAQGACLYQRSLWHAKDKILVNEGPLGSS